MPQAKNSVLFYTHASLPVSFPESETNCINCPVLGIEYHLNRCYCKSTGEFLLDTKHMRGGLCPLQFAKEETDGQQSSPV